MRRSWSAELDVDIDDADALEDIEVDALEDDDDDLVVLDDEEDEVDAEVDEILTAVAGCGRRAVG